MEPGLGRMERMLVQRMIRIAKRPKRWIQLRRYSFWNDLVLLLLLCFRLNKQPVTDDFRSIWLGFYTILIRIKFAGRVQNTTHSDVCVPIFDRSHIFATCTKYALWTVSMLFVELFFFAKTIIFFQSTKSAILFFLRCRKRVIGSFVWLDNLKIGVDSFSMQNHIMQISPNLFVTHTQAMLFFARSSYCFLSWTQKSGKLTSKIRCFYSFNCNLFKWHFFSSSTYFEVKKLNCSMTWITFFRQNLCVQKKFHSIFLKLVKLWLFQIQINHLIGMVVDKLDY